MNRLTEERREADGDRNSYDVAGNRRTFMTVKDCAGLRRNGKESVFLFYNGEILAEFDRDTMPVRRHLSGLGLSHMQTLNDGIYHTCHQDEQGSIAYITGNGGAVENWYDYDAFGNVHEQKEGIENYILYRGQ